MSRKIQKKEEENAKKKERTGIRDGSSKNTISKKGQPEIGLSPTKNRAFCLEALLCSF